jgi:DNA-binding CsgD family transcriptional regulator
MPPSPIYELALQLPELARGSVELPAFRRAALERLVASVPADVALFHELSPRSPLTRAAALHVDLGWLQSTLSTWDELAVLFGAMLTDAQAHGGVALARRAFAARARVAKQWSQRIARPLGVTDVVVMHLIAHERVISAIVLGRARKRPPFSERELVLLAQLTPVLTVCDAWLQQRAGTPKGMPMTVRCVDGRLTARQRELVEQVALGHADREIAASLSISPNTVRNLLVVVRSRLGAANRAEIVHRAVFA